MSGMNMGFRTYAAASTNRTTIRQVADALHLVISRLQAARDSGPVERLRALADNRRFWVAVSDILHDPTNWLPQETRAGMISVMQSVQQEMDSDRPDFDLLITINRRIAAGLGGKP